MSERWTPEEEYFLEEGLKGFSPAPTHAEVAAVLRAHCGTYKSRTPGGIYTHLLRHAPATFPRERLEAVRLCVRRLDREARAAQRLARRTGGAVVVHAPSVPPPPPTHPPLDQTILQETQLSELMRDPEYAHFHETFISFGNAGEENVTPEVVASFGTGSPPPAVPVKLGGRTYEVRGEDLESFEADLKECRATMASMLELASLAERFPSLKGDVKFVQEGNFLAVRLRKMTESVLRFLGL